MTKGLPIKSKSFHNTMSSLRKRTSNQKFTEADIIPINKAPIVPDVINNDNIVDIIDFPQKLQECIELDKELDRYFVFLSGLSRAELLTIVKYEVYNRVLAQQDLNGNLEKK